MKNEIAIGQTQELQIKKAKNQLSTVFSLIQSDEAIRLVNILKRIETDKGIEFLCSFENINWSVELIEKYKDQWDWFNLSRNTSLPWSIELIEKYKDQWHWDWGGLSWNESIHWPKLSINMVDEIMQYNQ